MSKIEQYKYSIPYDLKGKMKGNIPELAKVVLVNRMACKICRKCYKRLPLNATVCRGCKNSDLRTKKGMKFGKPSVCLNKNSKKKIIDKREIKK